MSLWEDMYLDKRNHQEWKPKFEKKGSCPFFQERDKTKHNCRTKTRNIPGALDKIAQMKGIVI